MDFFLLKDGVIQNVVAVETLAMAQQMYTDFTIVERTQSNAYNADGNPVGVGDTL